MATELGKRKQAAAAAADWSWSELPADLVAHIFGRLTSLVDFLNCRYVCASWERALRGEARRLAVAREEEHVPWLLFAVRAERSCLSSRVAPPLRSSGPAGSVRDVAAVQLPGRHARRGCREICLGSSFGWLVTADDSGCARVVNPLTGDAAPLPPIWRLPYLDAVHCYDGCVESFLYQDEHHRGGPGVPLSFAGLCDLVLLKAVVVDIGGGGATVAVLYRKKREFAMARTGQRSWRLVHNNLETIVDMTMHKDGKLYTAHLSGKIARWKIDCALHSSPEILESVLVIDSPYHYVVKDNGMMCREHEDGDRAGECSYLVGSPSGTLYLLRRLYKHKKVGGRTQRSTATFNVWFLTSGRDGMKWLSTLNGAIDSGLAVFVSYTGSVCVRQRDASGKDVDVGGAVYFTEESTDYIGAAMVENFGVRMVDLEMQGNTRVARRIMRDGEKSKKEEEEEEEEEKSEKVKQLGRCMNWPPPFWFIPSLEGLGATPLGKLD